MDSSEQEGFQPLPDTEQEYKKQLKELEQQIRLLREQVDFLTRKLYGTKSEKTSALEIAGQMSLFNDRNPVLIRMPMSRTWWRSKNICVKGNMPVSGRS